MHRDIQDSTAVGGFLNADDSHLAVVVAIFRTAAANALFVRIQYRQLKVVVALATPSPIDVEIVLALIAVAHE